MFTSLAYYFFTCQFCFMDSICLLLWWTLDYPVLLHIAATLILIQRINIKAIHKNFAILGIHAFHTKYVGMLCFYLSTNALKHKNTFKLLEQYFVFKILKTFFSQWVLSKSGYIITIGLYTCTSNGKWLIKKPKTNLN